jgi:hypothetical protein
MDFYRASNSSSWERLWKALYVEDGGKRLFEGNGQDPLNCVGFRQGNE